MAKSDRKYFLTGASGTIGSAVVPRLLADPSHQVTLLLRAADTDDLRRRREHLLAYWGAQVPEDAARRLHVLAGDITQPDLGLPADHWRTLAQTTTHVIHCAASVKLNMTLTEARASAVAPTMTLLDFGRQSLDRGSLRKMEFVSTVGVWGRSPGLLPEQPVPEVSSFHNTYEAAKAEAECALWEVANELPLTVHRPSMVVGETKTGLVPHFQVFYHLCEFLSGVRTFGIMPSLGNTRLDTVPVDWVADAIIWSCDQQDLSGKVLNLCSGPGRALPLSELQASVRRAWLGAGIAIPPVRVVPRRLLEWMIPAIGLVTGAKARRALRGLHPILAYLAEDQGFDNRLMSPALAAAGLPVPDPADYLEPVLSFYLGRRMR